MVQKAISLKQETMHIEEVGNKDAIKCVTEQLAMHTKPAEFTIAAEEAEAPAEG